MEKIKKVLVQCDFDGTVTEKDVSFMLLDAFANGNWRAVNQEYADDKITVGQFNKLAFGMVTATEKMMLDYIINNKVNLRSGFKEFVQICQEKGFRLVIVSNGLDFYIKYILGSIGLKDIEYHAAETRFYRGGLSVRYVGPDGNEVDSEFKGRYVNRYLNDGYQVVYIGDGTSDLSPARKCQQIFATESLLKHCQRTGLSCIPFTSFDEIINVIKTW